MPAATSPLPRIKPWLLNVLTTESVRCGVAV
jgi:hypothetical protein